MTAAAIGPGSRLVLAKESLRTCCAKRGARERTGPSCDKKLGASGFLVSEMCLGTMTFGGRGTFTSIGTLDQSLADRIRTSVDPPAAWTRGV